MPQRLAQTLAEAAFALRKASLQAPRRNHFEVILKPDWFEPVSPPPTLMGIRVDPPDPEDTSRERPPLAGPADHQPILKEITMHHIRTLAAAAVVAATAFAAASPAEAAPFHVIK